jgi:actin-related protein
MTVEEVTALVLEVGSCWTRAGYSGEDSPQCVIPTQIGRFSNDQSQSPLQFAESSTLYRDNLDIVHPLGPDGLGKFLCPCLDDC